MRQGVFVRLFLAQVCVLIGLVGSAFAHGLDHGEILTKFAFGSCNIQRGPSDHWDAINATAPQLWIWGGDNIYADRLWPAARRGEYNHLRNVPGYRALRESAKVIGTWDDHDFGYNDVGGEYEGKRDSQQLFLDFMDEPKDSPRRAQEGIYTSYLFGVPGRQVHVIILDLRYFRGRPGRNEDLLGEAQWVWLERELLASRAEVIVIESSSQLLSHQHGAEKWQDYPAARARMLALLDSSFRRSDQKLFVISGDRHFAEFSELRLPGGKLVTEFTASGLTHSSDRGRGERNDLRVGEVFGTRNFGVAQIDWNQYPAQVTLEARDHKGKLLGSLTR